MQYCSLMSSREYRGVALRSQSMLMLPAGAPKPPCRSTCVETSTCQTHDHRTLISGQSMQDRGGRSRSGAGTGAELIARLGVFLAGTFNGRVTGHCGFNGSRSTLGGKCHLRCRVSRVFEGGPVLASFGLISTRVRGPGNGWRWIVDGKQSV